MKSYAKRESFRSFIVFGLVGVLNTGIDVAVFSLLTWWQLPWLAAQIAGYGCGVLNSFLMNRKWTFKQQGPFAKGLLRFLLLNVLTLGLTSACMQFMHELLGISLWLSKGTATVFGVLLNFAGSKRWVFRQEAEAKSEAGAAGTSGAGGDI